MCWAFRLFERINMNTKELKMNLLLLGFDPNSNKYNSRNVWAHPDINNYYIRFYFYKVVVGRLKIDNRETMQPILDKVIVRIKQHESKRI